MNLKKKSYKSFTLIEILVVIVIIGVISAIIIISLSSIINSTNDSKRKHDMDTLQRSLLFYKSINGSYPTEATICNIGVNCSNLASALIPDYMPQFPTDPDTSNHYQYVSTTGSDFTIQSTLSNSYTYGYSSDTGFFLTANGVCGSANGGSFSLPPDSNLCASGTPSSVTTDTDPDYIWTCSVGGGTTANCTANISKASPCGTLGDVDEDSSVTKNDYSLAYYYVPITPFPPGADVNNNSDCDYDDVVQIYQYLIGGQSSFSGCP